jgi:hypothetical protein
MHSFKWDPDAYDRRDTLYVEVSADTLDYRGLFA